MDRFVLCQHHQVFSDGLAVQHPVERGLVQGRETPGFQDRAFFQWQRLDTVFHPLDYERGRV